MKSECLHLKPGFQPLHVATAHVCEECIQTGDTWVHLRTCQDCGKTHCCDSSPNRHATAHFHATGHIVVVSAEPGERWAWCYPHEVFLRY